jgi:hypothetical protein
MNSIIERWEKGVLFFRPTNNPLFFPLKLTGKEGVKE